ncbi:ommochrome-binding protein-like [Nymphalis io]|uniref:ommochrome-binding protein-like n=1 Tax=Inachis io TaxID=171585 RepID=UPI0021691AD1|nr:ommochrome-binding protein-like [Nymphalis io]XP_050343505.1 ommochrome-binding protein-like [Nymphalis io]
MKILVLLVVFTHSVTARFIDEKCDGVIVHNINHIKEVLKENIDSPYQLAIDYDTNMLFFSYSGYENISKFFSAYINLKTNEFQIIDGINGGFANAVDDRSNTVYLGGNDGIYKFDFETKRAHHIDGTTHNIWQIFFKKDLYYTNYPQEQVYVYKDGHSQSLPELFETHAMLVAIDNNDNIYFSNSTGLYVHKKAKNYVSFLGDYNLNGITSDITGNLYFSTPDGIYFIDDKSKRIEKLATIENIYGMAVESDGNIIYASQDKLVRLKPTKTHCFVNEKPEVDVF